MTSAGTSPSLLHVSSAPHVRAPRSVPVTMLWVIGALLPALAAGTVFFGWRALLVVAVSTASAVLAELLAAAVLLRPVHVHDLSSVVTGLLLGLSMPPTVPIWIPVVGSVFAVAIVKVAFGGLGHNFLNPALAARLFLLLSFPTAMRTFVAPLNGFIDAIDGTSGATPLSHFREAVRSGQLQPLDLQEALGNLFAGNAGGCIGETSAALLLLGALALVYGHISSMRIPSLFVGTVFLLYWLFNGTGDLFTTDALIVPVYQILSGGLLLTALFMAPEPVTSPVTPWGKGLFGMGCGLLTFLFRVHGTYPEGAGVAVLIMNCLVPLIDRYTRPRPFGGKRP